jgi:hypothetical protein
MTLRRDVGLGFLAATILAAGVLAFSLYGPKKAPVEADVATTELAPELSAWIAVASDPRSRYRARDVERAGRGQVRIVVERDRSGVKHYDERLIDCSRHVFSLEREADSQAALGAKARAKADATPWAARTPDDKIARYACAVAPL